MEEKTKAKESVELAEIVTQTETGYKLPDGKVVTFPEFLVWLANQVIELKKGLL